MNSVAAASNRRGPYARGAIKTLCLVILSVGFACAAPQTGNATPEDANAAIIQAFDTHSIVMFADAHAYKYRSTISTERLLLRLSFSKRWTTSSLSMGTPCIQGTVDRYVAGEDVPIEEVQKAWRNTMALGLSRPPTSLFSNEAVRQANWLRYCHTPHPNSPR